MKKKLVPPTPDSPKESMVGWGYGYVVSDNTPGYLEGRLLTLLESFGLKETQEKAAKDLIRQCVWDVFSDSVFISSETHNQIRNRWLEEKKKSENRPVSAV